MGWGLAEGEVDLGFKDGTGTGLGQCGVQGEASLLTSMFSALFSLRSLLLSELYQLLVYPVTPGHVVLRHDNKLTAMVCFLPDNLPHTQVMELLTPFNPQYSFIF